MKFSRQEAENSPKRRKTPSLNLPNGGDPSDEVLPPSGGKLHPSRQASGNIKNTEKRLSHMRSLLNVE
jgi:hypothetical protein